MATITDHYVFGTRLRLRRSVDHSGIEPTVYKLTQKVPAPDGDPGLVTNLYLSVREYELLCQLPGERLDKLRYSMTPFGVDQFSDRLRGLVLCEADFWSDFVATYPNATIIGGFGINVGSGWSAMTGEADTLTIGTAATFSYDFEPVAAPTSPGIQITTTSLPPGLRGMRYSATLAASGDNLPYKWSVSFLPVGLHLNKATGVIAGTPQMNDGGMFTFNVTVVDRKIHHMRNSATEALSITIS